MVEFHCVCEFILWKLIYKVKLIRIWKNSWFWMTKKRTDPIGRPLNVKFFLAQTYIFTCFGQNPMEPNYGVQFLNHQFFRLLVFVLCSSWVQFVPAPQRYRESAFVSVHVVVRSTHTHMVGSTVICIFFHGFVSICLFHVTEGNIHICDDVLCLVKWPTAKLMHAKLGAVFWLWFLFFKTTAA